MKLINTLLIAILAIQFSMAQRPSGNGNGAGQGGNLKIGRVYGKILDENKKPVAYASVTLSISKGKKDSLITGGLTEDNGDFNLTELPFGRYKVKVTYVGYKEFSQFVVVRPPDNVEQDLGNIRLEIDSKVLNEVNVTAEKSQTQLALDRQVFNVGRNAAASGGTAEDVLKAVPSVTLDVDGNAKLRNNSTTVYFDGRPSPFSLNQIPADQIERVEIITNPSAKFEAQSAGGIINIVTKKNRKPGYNGFASLGAGTGNRYNGTLSLNVKEGKFNFTGFANLNNSRQPSEGYTNRINYKNGLIDNYFNQVSDAEFRHKMQMARLSLDYQVDNRNTVTLGANYTHGAHNFFDFQDYTFRNAAKDTISKGLRTIEPANAFYNFGTQLTWKKSFPKKGKELITDLSYNRGFSNNEADWFTSEYLFDNKTTTITRNDITGGNNSNQAVLQMDFTNPLNDSTKFETGIRLFYNNRIQDFTNTLILSDGTRVPLTDFAQNFDLTDMINAAYATYGSRLRNGINYQLGVRFEQSFLQGNSLIAEKEDFGYQYPKGGSDWLKSFFPSAYFSKKLKGNQELQFNLSRKINRPNWRQIMPVIMNADRQNVMVGNPALQPQFINLMEVNYNKIFKSNNYLVSAYARNEVQPIIGFTSPFEGDSSLVKNSFINGDNSWVYGLDNTLKLEIAKKLEITTSVNAFVINLVAQDIKREGFAWFSKMNVNYKLPRDFSLQAQGTYESPKINLQGEEKDNYFMDLSLRKDITMADVKPSKFQRGPNNPRLGSITFTVSDVFDTKRNLRTIEQGSTINNVYVPTFVQDVNRRRETRFFRVTLQFFFGKPDASMFKRNTKRQNNQGGESQMDF